MRKRLRRECVSSVPLLALIAAGLAAGGLALAAGSGKVYVIRACSAKHGGALRLAHGPCAKHTEVSISWNQRGLPGSNGVDGASGAPGTARAYGLVGANLSVTRSRNITAVTQAAGGDGRFCIRLAPSIVPLGTGAVVTPDYSHDDTQTGEAYQPQAFAEWRSEPVGCPADALEVVTGVRTVTAAGQAQPNTQPVVVTAVSNTLKNQPFFIVVP